MKKSAAIGTIALLILVFVCGCVDAQEVPTAVYRSEFDSSKIDAVERVVDEVAQRWKLSVYKKNREHMKHLTPGHDAFYVALYFENDPVLVLSNVGVGTVLTLHANDFGKLPVHKLNGAANFINDTLRNRLSIEMRLQPTRADSVNN